MSSIFQRLAQRRRTPLLSAWVPYEDYLSSQVRLLSSGAALAMFEVAGRASDTKDGRTLMQWMDDVNSVIRNIGSDRLVIKTAVCRGYAEAEEWPEADCSIPFVASLMEAYREKQLDRSLYSNRIFLALEYRPASPAGEWIGDKVAAKTVKVPGGSDSARDRMNALEDICSQVEEDLKEYGLRRLGLEGRGPEGREVVCDEIAEAEVFITTGVRRWVGMSTGRIGNAMFSEDVTFHYEHVEIRGPGQTHFVAHLGFRQYPATTFAGMLDRLLAEPFRFSLVQTFRCMEQSEGQDVIGRKQNRMVAAGDKAFSQRDDLVHAADDLQSGRFIMGDHCLTLAVFAEQIGGNVARIYARLLTGLRRAHLPLVALEKARRVMDDVIGPPGRDPLQKVVNRAWNALAKSGCVVARENKGLMGAWLSMISGNHRFRVRPGAISSRNFAAMNSLHGTPTGARKGRWGDPIAVTVSSNGTPHLFHWHDGSGENAVGNTLITGVTGGGKTTSTSFLIAATIARIWEYGGGWIGLDHKRGWNALTLAMGGSYSALGGGEPHFAPLKALPNTIRSREFLYSLFEVCIRQGGWRLLTTEEEHWLAVGIEAVMENPPEDRHLMDIVAMLGDQAETAGARLRKWCWGEELGWVLDAPADRIDMAGDLNCFDTTRLLENKRAAGPAMLYLFYRIEMRLDGRPLLISVDEGWYVVMREENTAPAIDKISRTIRSKNGVLVFLTQSPADAVAAGLSAALVEQFPNQMHFANPNASRADYVDGLKCNEGEWEALQSLKKGDGRFLYRKGSESSLQAVPLHGLDDELAILSLSQANQPIIDAMPEEVRANPAVFQAEFQRERRLLSQRSGARTRFRETA